MFNWRLFVDVLLAGEILVILQAILAFLDGYFTQANMQQQGIMNGYSFIEHGGMWADVFIVSPGTAYLVAKYHFAYTAWWSWTILAVGIGFAAMAGSMYNEFALKHPTPHSHNGKTTTVGWIHAAYAIPVIWIGGMFYLTPTSPAISPYDLIATSAVLTPFFVLGILDFNQNWEFLPEAKEQLWIEIPAIWIVTGIRLLWR